VDKRYLRHVWIKLRAVKVWYLLAVLLMSIAIFVVSMRSNNLTMVSLREEVYVADKNNGDVEGALQRLRAYVHGHMNTNLASDSSGVYPPIQLKYTYERLKKAEQERVNQANSQVYTDAQATCERQFPGSFSGGPRVPCIEKYVSEHGVKAKSIPDALYKFDFTSPTWSPDAAGFSLLVVVLFGLLTVLRALAGLISSAGGRRPTPLRRTCRN
jgi:hypothetical protein